MSTSVELGDGTTAMIEVHPERGSPDFLCAFARRCFFVGDFPARDERRHRWLLDCRVGLGDGSSVRAMAATMVQVAAEKNLTQFVGGGFGAYFLLGAILSTATNARGGLLRPQRKPYGATKWVEGVLNKDEPVCVVDDILNSGESASGVVKTLRSEGFQPTQVLCIFRFAWGKGSETLARLGVESTWLATVQRKGITNSSKRPATKRRGFLGWPWW